MDGKKHQGGTGSGPSGGNTSLGTMAEAELLELLAIFLECHSFTEKVND